MGNDLLYRGKVKGENTADAQERVFEDTWVIQRGAGGGWRERAEHWEIILTDFQALHFLKGRAHLLMSLGKG